MRLIWQYDMEMMNIGVSDEIKNVCGAECCDGDGCIMGLNSINIDSSVSDVHPVPSDVSINTSIQSYFPSPSFDYFKKNAVVPIAISLDRDGDKYAFYEPCSILPL